MSSKLPSNDIASNNSGNAITSENKPRLLLVSKPISIPTTQHPATSTAVSFAYMVPTSVINLTSDASNCTPVGVVCPVAYANDISSIGLTVLCPTTSTSLGSTQTTTETNFKDSHQPPLLSATAATSPHTHHKHRSGRHCQPKEDRRCGVCGDKALSCNFDALCCESCKAFFRRNATKELARLKCPYQENCTISVSTRRLCTLCRLQRCFEIGMKKQYILSTEERHEKRRKICRNKLLKKLEERQWIPHDLSMAELEEKYLLSSEEICQIDEVIHAYDNSLKVTMDQRSGRVDAPGLTDLVNFAEISIRRAIEMFKRIHAFSNLDKATQMGLLKSGCVELLVLRGVLSYDPLKQHFLDAADNESADALSLQSFVSGAGAEAGLAFQHFTQTLLQRTKGCRVTVLLLLLVCLFSERTECLLNTSQQKSQDDEEPSSSTTTTVPHSLEINTDVQNNLEMSQLYYSQLLKKFLGTKWNITTANRVFPHLMMSLSELRTINMHFSRRMLNINIMGVTPLMTELLDFTAGVAGSNCQSPDEPETSFSVCVSESCCEHSHYQNAEEGSSCHQPSGTTTTAHECCVCEAQKCEEYQSCSQADVELEVDSSLSSPTEEQTSCKPP